MILNVIKEGEYSNNNTNKYADTNDKVQLKRIKELLNEQELKYVSDNIIKLLQIKVVNDLSCFELKLKRERRVVKAGEKFRVILYIRLSREDGDLDDGDVSGSIKNQLLFLLDECQKKDWVVVGIFCEEDESGADDNRPEWLKAIRFAESGNTEIFLCKSQSRFTRSMEMVEKYIHKCFPEWNIRFIGLVDSTDSNDEGNKKSRQINGLVNEWYVEDTSKNTRATLNSMKKNGQFVGNVAPYGYLIDPNDKHHLIPDPYAREAVKIMFGMLKCGKSLEQVAEVLMRKHFLTPPDYKRTMGLPIGKKQKITHVRYQVEKNDTLTSLSKKFYVTKNDIKKINNINFKIKEGDIILIPCRQRWEPKMIRKIVTDETHIGTLVQGKSERTSFKNKKLIKRKKEDWIRVPHCHEANIDLNTFNIVSSLFETKTKYKPQKNGEVPLFSKKVYCACCGKALYKNRTVSNEYLRCITHIQTKGLLCDNVEAINLGEFKQYILNEINKRIDRYFDLNKINDELYIQSACNSIDDKVVELKSEKENIKIRIKEKQDFLVQIYEDKSKGTLSHEEFMILKNNNSLEIDKLNKKLLEIDMDITKLNQDKDKQYDLDSICQKYKNIKELNRIVLDAFISKIEIGKSDIYSKSRPINIVWNFNNF